MVAVALLSLVPVVRIFLSDDASKERSIQQRLAEVHDVTMASVQMVACNLNLADVRAARRVFWLRGIDLLVAAMTYRGSLPSLERGFAALDAIFAAHLRDHPAADGK